MGGARHVSHCLPFDPSVESKVCYDDFLPELERELSNRGTEVIGWPVWGCNSELARAAESHVFLVSTTYEDIAPNFMVSAIFDLTGKTTALAKEWGTHAVAEVDLDETPARLH